MEVGSKVLREVEFRQQMRGYHQDDVDTFLEEVAAGIEVLQDRLREANERAARAEAARLSQPASDGGHVDDAARRALDVAQRTVSLLIKEAKEEARHLVAEAEARAHVIIGAAEEAADRRMLEGRNQLRDEVTRLTAARAELAGEVSELGERIEEGRREAAEALRRALELLEGERRSGRSMSDAGPSPAAPDGAEDSNGVTSGGLHRGASSGIPGASAARDPGAPGSAGESRGSRSGQIDPRVRVALDDPEATRMLRLDSGAPEPGGVFDVEQADS